MYPGIRRKVQFVCYVTYLFKNLIGAKEPFLQLSKVLTSDRALTTWAKPYVNPITDVEVNIPSMGISPSFHGMLCFKKIGLQFAKNCVAGVGVKLCCNIGSSHIQNLRDVWWRTTKHNFEWSETNRGINGGVEAPLCQWKEFAL